MKGKIAAIPVLALCLSASVQAQPQRLRPCITDREMHGLVAYFLPAVIDEVSANCSVHLPAASFLRAGLPRLQSALSENKEAAWPLARAAFFKIADSKDGKQMAKLSDRALRPLVDEILAEKMSLKVDAPMCGEISDIAEALAPLSPDQSVHLLATIFNAVARKDKSMRSCPRSVE